MKLLPISDQVIVITGASSGIGLTTARMAARAGARVVMTSRDEETLRLEAERIHDAGGQATWLAGDVTDPELCERVARHAVLTFGRIDTWVNNAGISVYGLTQEVALEDMRRVFGVTYWGVVHGCLAAVPRLRERGGALINVGSIESDISIPFHSSYSAAKHAVKGFTNALRMELEHEGAGIAVSLIKPAGIDTPFFEHAKNYMPGNPKPPPPAYAPEVVARAILHCAQRQTRELLVGGAGRAMVGLARWFPRTSDKVFEATLFDAQQTDRPTRHDRMGSLYTTGPFNGRQRGQYRGMVRDSSLSTSIALRPVQTAVGVGLLSAAVMGAFGVMRSARRTREASGFDLRATQRWSRHDVPTMRKPELPPEPFPLARDLEVSAPELRYDPPDLTQPPV
ncbi:MAG: SDR family oxidoreductase [Polyangiales bacterium]